MKKYLEISKIFYKTQLIWRFDIVVNVLFTIVKIVFAYLIWSNIFADRQTVSGFTFHTMLTYYIISSFLSQLDMSESISSEISTRIRTGTFSKYMVIPVNMQGYFIAQAAGASVFYLLFNFMAAIVWVFIFRIHFVVTGNPMMLFGSATLVIMGLIFMVQLNYFLGLLTLKFQDIYLFLMIKSTLVSFITGTMMPLSLLPDPILVVLRLLPFYYISYLPSMLLIGKNENELRNGIIILAFWVAILIPINKFTFQKLRMKYDGVGI